MEDGMLKRLLDAETEAEQVVARADTERQAIIDQATRDARVLEEQQAKRIAEIHASFVAQAKLRAEQTIATMQRRYGEQALTIRASAKHHEQDALAKVLTLLTGMKKL